MAEIDVTDVLTDVDFMEALTALVCLRNTQVMGANGVAQYTQQALPFYGTVTSDRGLLLNREPGGSRIDGSIVVVTKFRLQDGSGAKSLAADVVRWRGTQYTVVHIDPYPQYGQGFVQALCDLVPITGG